MAIVVASLPGLNLFSSFPSKPPLTDPSAATSNPPLPPIPIPRYPPKPLQYQNPKPSKPHKKYPKPVSEGVISSDGDRSVVIGESGVSYLLPGAPFEFQYSYSETPNVKPLAIREPAFLPFAPPSMPRPWTGKAPSKKKKKKVRLFESLNPPPDEVEGSKLLRTRGPISMMKLPREMKTREEILGEPLTREEITKLVRPLINYNRQVNLGRDGLTHNMLELIHTHWKIQPVCKVRCKGVPTVDIYNVCRHLEEKTGGKIIFRVGSSVYLFRGRNYNRLTRPQYPVMLWKPAAPVYPKLIQEAPEGLTKVEADELRMKGKRLIPICKLAKNGVYISLVRDVRNAFEESPLVKVNCKGMKPTDYKKLGAKLKELVPCVLLSFDDEQILMWRGQGWKSMYRASALISGCSDATSFDGSANPNIDVKAVRLSSRLMSLWKQVVQSSNALLLEDMNLDPDALLEKVEECERISQAAEYSEDNYSSYAEHGDCPREEEDDDDGFNTDYMCDESESYKELEASVPYGSLPIDAIAEQLISETPTD